MAAIQRLYDLRNRFDNAAGDEKLSILSRLSKINARSAGELMRLHSALCFVRAFPDTAEHHRLADAVLCSFEKQVQQLDTKVQQKLCDSGIAGTAVHYGFSYEVASWLARRTQGAVSIDWADTDDPACLDELLAHCLHPAEDEFFDSGVVSSRAWIEQAAARAPGTDFDWLLAQLKQRQFKRIWSQLYDAANLWLCWDLGRSRFSKSRNVFPGCVIKTRKSGMRRPVGPARQEIARPLTSVAHLERRDGQRLIDVAMASLAVRHRETFHFNHANPGEVYIADVGRGVGIALFGLLPEHRFPLECTMGYLILANGVPIGYGGSSIVFRQVNTGVNFFDEYRKSEAAFLWVQVMRVYHALAGCNRFIANAYQFGASNSEALKSGAFWFYYRLGYRPVAQDVRILARQEAHRMRRNKSYRSDMQTLRQLASCDMHLTLPGARASEYFDEQWLTTSSALATRTLAEAGGNTRRVATQRLASSLVEKLGIRNFGAWTAPERAGLALLAPIVVATDPGSWGTADRRAMRPLLRAKGGDLEANYVRQLGRHGTFLAALRSACRNAEKSIT